MGVGWVCLFQFLCIFFFVSLLLYVTCAEGSACFAFCGGIASFDHSGSDLRSMGPSRHGVCRRIARELLYWFVDIDWTFASRFSAIL